MATFITRVELHGATEGDYQVLHAAMEKGGFYRILDNDGIKYQMPTAEYVSNFNSTPEAVRNAAKAIANTTGKTSWILTVESAGMAWELPLVK